jgi:hypothetical protein
MEDERPGVRHQVEVTYFLSAQSAAMAKKIKGALPPRESEELLRLLQARFEKYTSRHLGLDWKKIQQRLEKNAEKLWSLNEMEKTGGEPDVTGYDQKKNEYIFVDCSAETPKGRLSLCYDEAALAARKEFKPKGSALGVALAMGVEILDEQAYRHLQQLGTFDAKTSSWIKTPPDIRKLGGALFGDYRYGTVFIYHNGAQSYYGSRGFRAVLRV